MKKILKRVTALSMALVMMLGVMLTAQATETEKAPAYGIYNEEIADGYDLKFLTSAGAEDTAVTQEGIDCYKQTVKFKLSFSGEANGQYVVFLLSDGAKVPTQTTIRYIDQSGTENGTVEFTIYPDTLAKTGTYTVCVSGVSNSTVEAATFEVYALGDVDQDGTIGPYDASLVLQYIAEKTELTGVQKLAADTDRDGAIGPYDASLILQYIAEKIEGF